MRVLLPHFNVKSWFGLGEPEPEPNLHDSGYTWDQYDEEVTIDEILSKAGLERKDAFYRYVSPEKVDEVLQRGTDRHEKSTMFRTGILGLNGHPDRPIRSLRHSLRNMDFSLSDEANLMLDNDVTNRAYTNYMFDFVETETNSGAFRFPFEQNVWGSSSNLYPYSGNNTLQQLTEGRALLIYEKDDDIQSSADFHVFKRHPSEFLVCSITNIDGQIRVAYPNRSEQANNADCEM